MKPSWIVLIACLAACGGKKVGTEIEKLKDTSLALGQQTDAVCFLAERLQESDAKYAILEHTERILKSPQTDKAALNAQIDCIATGAYKASEFPFGDNLIRAYAKHPSDAVKATFKFFGEGDTLRTQLVQYMAEISLRAEDAREAAEVTPGILSALDELRVNKTYLSGGLMLLWARTDNPKLKARIDGATPDQIRDAWNSAVDLIERGPEGDRKRLVEKLLADVDARKIEFYREAPCKLVPTATGCTAVLAAKAEADKKSAAEESPILAILQPAQQAAAKAPGQPDMLGTFNAEQDGTAPSPVSMTVVEVPEMATAADKLAALGGASVEKDCRTYMRFGGPGGLVCARALGKIKQQLLIDATVAYMTEYNTAYAKNGKKAHKEGHGVVLGLRALMDYKGKAVDDVYLQSLSAYDPELAKFVMAKVKERASMEQVVDGLFQFMARKDKFAVAEIDNYVGLLTSYGDAATGPIVKNLERELAKAKKPEKVFWAHKVVALFALEQAGTAAATPILDKYATDPSGYLDLKTFADSGATASSKEVPFVDVVARTKRAVAGR